MLGRGDWKAYRNKTDDQLEEVYKQKAEELFTAERMIARLATFEHLTLKSLKNQSDPGFRLLVVSSDRMPAEYRQKLTEICAGTAQVSRPRNEAKVATKGIMPVVASPAAAETMFCSEMPKPM